MRCCGGCHLTACSLTFICSPPRAALSRDRAKNAHKKRRDGGAWRHYNTHNSYNTCWWYKNFQGRSARLSAQQQPTTVQIVVAVGPQQHRIQSTISHQTSWILMMLNIIPIVDCSSIKCPAASWSKGICNEFHEEKLLASSFVSSTACIWKSNQWLKCLQDAQCSMQQLGMLNFYLARHGKLEGLHCSCILVELISKATQHRVCGSRI